MPEPDTKVCAGTKNNGEPCGVTPDLLIEDEEAPGTWYCFNHAPWLEEARDAARSKGGFKKAAADAAARANRPRYLSTHDLGDLETPADAQRWASIIAASVVTGKLSSNAAGVALKALEAWIKSHESVDTTKRLEQLEQQVAEEQRQRQAEQERRDRERPPYMTRSPTP